MLHFGDQDKHIPAEVVSQIANALKGHKQAQVLTYHADHGFNCDQKAAITDLPRCWLTDARRSFLIALSALARDLDKTFIAQS